MNFYTFGDRLKIVMRGESNHSFAIKCKISEGSLRNYLKGDTSPDLKTLQLIAEVSSCSVGWLASGEGDMKRGEKSGQTGPVAKETHREAEEYLKNGMQQSNHAWFHEWIEEELQGKSISEIMEVAIKIKTVLDEK